MRARGRGPDSSVVATPVFFEGRLPPHPSAPPSFLFRRPMRAPGHHAPHDRPPSVSHTCSTSFTFLRCRQLQPHRRGRVGHPKQVGCISGGSCHVPPPPSPSQAVRATCSSLSSLRATLARRDNRQRQRRPHFLSRVTPLALSVLSPLLSTPYQTPRETPPVSALFEFFSSSLWIGRRRDVEAHSIDTHALTHARSNGCVLARVCVAFTLLFRSARFSHPDPFHFFFSFLHARTFTENTHGEELRRAFFTSPGFLFCITLSRAAQHLVSVLRFGRFSSFTFAAPCLARTHR